MLTTSAKGQRTTQALTDMASRRYNRIRAYRTTGANPLHETDAAKVKWAVKFETRKGEAMAAQSGGWWLTKGTERMLVQLLELDSHLQTSRRTPRLAPKGADLAPTSIAPTFPPLFHPPQHFTLCSQLEFGRLAVVHLQAHPHELATTSHQGTQSYPPPLRPLPSNCRRHPHSSFPFFSDSSGVARTLTRGSSVCTSIGAFPVEWCLHLAHHHLAP